MNSYEEKQEARRARYEALAEKARAESNALYERSHKMAEVIPFGQPILAGHHSEKWDRAYRGKISRAMDKSVEFLKKAEYYAEKAESVGTGGISSYDPDAIAKLTDKLEKLKKAQEDMKAANRAIRLKDKTKGDAKLAEMGYTPEQIARLREPDFCGRIGFPDYALTNNNANIHRIEQRIKTLQKMAEMKPVSEENELYEYKIDDGRIQFIFDGKPADDVLSILKHHAFKWSPSRGAWVRQATGNGFYAAEQVKKALAELETAE